jgi:hypothetical protein
LVRRKDLAGRIQSRLVSSKSVGSYRGTSSHSQTGVPHQKELFNQHRGRRIQQAANHKRSRLRVRLASPPEIVSDRRSNHCGKELASFSLSVQFSANYPSFSLESNVYVAAIVSIVETCQRLEIPVRDYLGSTLPGWLPSESIGSHKSLADPKFTKGFFDTTGYIAAGFLRHELSTPRTRTSTRVRTNKVWRNIRSKSLDEPPARHDGANHQRE